MRTTAADQYRVTYWTSEQGLPQNTVGALLQTRDGYLWAGTRYGLARFDGLRFAAFVNELSALNSETLNVRGLVEDTRGRLWLHSWETLVCFHQGRFAPVPLDAAPFPGRIQHICASRDGGLWIAKARGLFHFNEGKVERVFTVKEVAGSFCGDVAEIERMFLDTQGRLWVKVSCFTGTQTSWHRLNPLTGTVEALADTIGLATEDIGAVMEDRAGRLWAGRPGELLCWDGRLSRFAANEAYGNRRVEALAEDKEGNVWIVARGPRPLHRFAHGKFTGFGRAEGITSPDDLRCVLPDREGNVWVGSGAGGLYRLEPRPLVSLLTGSYSAMDEVYSVAPGRDGRVWLATTYGLVSFHAGQFVVYTNFAGLSDPGGVLRIRPVFEDRAGTVWCGLDHHGLQTLRDGEIAPMDSPAIGGTARQRVQGMLEDRAGSLWITTQQGLWQRHAGEQRLWTTNDGLGDNEVFGLAEGTDGSLWVGSQRGGIHHLKEGRIHRYSVRDGLLHDNAWPLRAEPDGAVWVGTPNGLNRIRGNEIRAVTMREGLFDNLAYALLEDRRSNYWTFGNRGIWRMKKAELQAVADGSARRVLCVSYGEADGMVSSEGNGDQQPNAVALPNGELWFPTTRGVVIVDPEKLRDNEVPPGVVIEEVRVDEETVFKDGGVAKPEIRNPKSETNSNSEVLTAPASMPTGSVLPASSPEEPSEARQRMVLPARTPEARYQL
ncbi:MAG TPA: two-component regulator propeller domain-containing protein, partial [Verrucomicrobiae bacterium]